MFYTGTHLRIAVRSDVRSNVERIVADGAVDLLSVITFWSLCFSRWKVMDQHWGTELERRGFLF